MKYIEVTKSMANRLAGSDIYFHAKVGEYAIVTDSDFEIIKEIMDEEEEDINVKDINLLEELYAGVEFTEEEWSAVTGEDCEDCMGTLENTLNTVAYYRGTMEDAVFIADDLFAQLRLETRKRRI